MSEYGGPTHRVRTSDAEREQVVEILRAAMGEGRLSLAEGEERIAAAYGATYRDELTPLTGDLPDGDLPGRVSTPYTERRDRQGQRYVYRHAGFVVAAAAALVGLWALSGAHFFWPLIPLLFLWFGLFRHVAWRRWHGYGARYGGWRDADPEGWGGPRRGWGPPPAWLRPTPPPAGPAGRD
jgi:hypothetical protein